MKDENLYENNKEVFIRDLENGKEQAFNPNRSLETELALFLMTAIRKMWLYIVGS